MWVLIIKPNTCLQHFYCAHVIVAVLPSPSKPSTGEQIFPHSISWKHCLGGLTPPVPSSRNRHMIQALTEYRVKAGTGLRLKQGWTHQLSQVNQNSALNFSREALTKDVHFLPRLFFHCWWPFVHDVEIAYLGDGGKYRSLMSSFHLVDPKMPNI